MLAYIAFFTLCRLFFFCEFRFSLLFVRRIFFFCFCFSVFGCVLVYWAGVTFFHAENRSFFLFFPFRLNHVAESPSLPHKYSFLLFFFLRLTAESSVNSQHFWICLSARFSRRDKKGRNEIFPRSVLDTCWIDDDGSHRNGGLMAHVDDTFSLIVAHYSFTFLRSEKRINTLSLSLFLFLKLNLLFSKRFPS